MERLLQKRNALMSDLCDIDRLVELESKKHQSETSALAASYPKGGKLAKMYPEAAAMFTNALKSHETEDDDEEEEEEEQDMNEGLVSQSMVFTGKGKGKMAYYASLDHHHHGVTPLKKFIDTMRAQHVVMLKNMQVVTLTAQDYIETLAGMRDNLNAIKPSSKGTLRALHRAKFIPKQVRRISSAMRLANPT